MTLVPLFHVTAEAEAAKAKAHEEDLRWDALPIRQRLHERFRDLFDSFGVRAARTSIIVLALPSPPAPLPSLCVTAPLSSTPTHPQTLSAVAKATRVCVYVIMTPFVLLLVLYWLLWSFVWIRVPRLFDGCRAQTIMALTSP